MTELSTTARRYGRTGLTISSLGVGTSGWDTLSAASASAILAAATEAGIDFVDTSNIYAGGRAETMLGGALAQSDPASDPASESAVSQKFTLQTKLDRDVVTGDFSYDQMYISVRQSLTRLGVESVPVLMLHDPENIGFEAAMVPGGPVDALVAMRDEGLADSIGISGGPVDMLQRFVETDIFDTLITHNRFTLLDQSAEALLAAAGERDLGICNAAPFGAGILTGDPRFAGRYAYSPIDDSTAAAFQRLSDVCAELGIPIGAAALQFSLRDPRIHCTVVGISSEARLHETTALADFPIANEAWARILDAVATQRG